MTDHGIRLLNKKLLLKHHISIFQSVCEAVLFINNNISLRNRTRDSAAAWHKITFRNFQRRTEIIYRERLEVSTGSLTEPREIETNCMEEIRLIDIEINDTDIV